MPIVEAPREIETLEDVHAVLDSGHYSFEEALDCVRVSRVHQDWEQTVDCAAAALGSIGNRHVPRRAIEEAALYLVVAHLKAATSLGDLASPIQRSVDFLGQAISDGGAFLQSATADVRRLVAEVAVLLTDTEPASYVALSSRLRRLGRPDLARTAATSALEREPGNPKALTTRGAASIDVSDLPSAERDLREAWGVGESAFVANAVSRLRLVQSRNDDALEWAERAVKLRPGKASWATVAAAARAAGNSRCFDDAVRRLQDDGSDQLSLFADGYSHRWPLYLAGLTLVRAGRLDEARALAAELEGTDYAPAKKLQIEIRAAEIDRSGGSTRRSPFARS